MANQFEMREIPDFPGYFAGNDGSIWSGWLRGGRDTPGRTDKLRQLKPRAHIRSSHHYVKTRWRERGFIAVHRMVLWAFMGPAPEGMECRHLNGNPQDNRLENLKWGTRKENIADAIKHGTFVNHGTKKKRSVA